MPFGVDLPCTSGGGCDSGDAAGSENVSAALKQIDELSGKLDEKEALIYDILNKAVPTVDIPMPKLNPSMFGDSEPESRPLLADSNCEHVEQDGKTDVSEGNVGAKCCESKAKKKAETLRQQTEAARKKAEQAQQEMADEAKQAMEQAGGATKQILGQTFTAASSVALAIGFSYAPLSPLMGQMLAAVTAAVVNFVGLGMSWKTRANSIFQVLNKVFDRMINKVTDILDTVDDLIMGPLEKLENAIEDMAAEQKPTLDNMKKFETTLKMADPDFDLPDPADLQKPLDGCDDMIDDFVGKAKKEIPDKMDEMIQSSFAGKVATDEGQFNMFVVYLPLLIALLFNVSLAAAQVAIMFKPPAPESADEKDLVQEVHERRLRGAAALQEYDSFALPGGLPMDTDSLMPYVQPALMQIVLSGLQAVGILIMSSGPRVCGLVNSAITSFGKKVNDRVNLRIKTAVDKVFGEAFTTVKEKSDQFFPKFKSATASTKEAMESAAQFASAATAAAGTAKDIGNALGGAWK